jgi:hypothetical protein
MYWKITHPLLHVQLKENDTLVGSGDPLSPEVGPYTLTTADQKHSGKYRYSKSQMGIIEAKVNSHAIQMGDKCRRPSFVKSLVVKRPSGTADQKISE